MGAKGWDLDPPSATFPEKKILITMFYFYCTNCTRVN